MRRAIRRPIPQVGTTTYRPPYTPVSLGALAGHHRGKDFRPTRLPPSHQWALEQGAVMGVQIERLDDRPTFQLVAFRSLAGSLWSWLTKSAAEFGYEMLQLNRPGTRHVA